MRRLRTWVVVNALLATCFPSVGISAPPAIRADGTIEVPSFELPPSEYLSPEAREMLRKRAHPAAHPAGDANAAVEARIADMRKLYPVNVEEQVIAGVPARVFTPRDKPFDRRRVLLQFHGGGFKCCFHAASMFESTPISVLGGYKVISIDYRQAPEHRHPAALEDAVAVYKELLKSYDAGRIGVYGCSAGGGLTAMLVSWLAGNGVRRPGAVGIFGAGATNVYGGDSVRFAGHILEGWPLPDPASSQPPNQGGGPSYFDGVDVNAPANRRILSPVDYPELIAKFPPTMLVTGTRAGDMSMAIHTNTELLKAGIDTTLVVAEGLGHCYLASDYELPEARDAQQLVANFFHEHLR